MAIQAIEKAIRSLVNQGRRGIRIDLQHIPSTNTIRLHGTTPTYYEKQLAIQAALQAAGDQAQICAQNIEVA